MGMRCVLFLKRSALQGYALQLHFGLLCPAVRSSRVSVYCHTLLLCTVMGSPCNTYPKTNAPLRSVMQLYSKMALAYSTYLKTNVLPELCLAAVLQNGLALQYVPDDKHTPELCLYVSKQCVWPCSTFLKIR